MQIQNKLIDSNSPQNQNSFHINNFRKYVVVTSSTYNLTINHKNIIKNGLNRGDFVELYSDKSSKQYKVLGFLEPLPLIDCPIRVSLKYKNNVLEVDMSDIKKNLNAFSRMSNKSLKNSYAALDYKPIQI